MAENIWLSPPAGDGALTPRQGGRLAAVLYIASGVVTGISPLLPAPSGVEGGRVLGVGVVAVVIGLIAMALPWDRWPRRAAMSLMPIAYLLIALHNHWGGADPYRYSLFFMVSFLWVGLAQPRFTSLLASPLAGAAYVIPLAIADVPDWAMASALYALPVMILTGEATAWVADRLRAAQAARVHSEERFRALVQNSSDGIVVIDASGVIQFASPVAERLVGLPFEELAGKRAIDFLHPGDVESVSAGIAELATTPGHSEVAEMRMRRRDGTWRWVQTTATNLLDDENVRGVLVNFRDTTERRELQDQLTYQAFHDQLTGLVNRRVMWDRVEHALARADRTDEPVSVLFVDLDGFKNVNDTLGHDAGDRLLVAVAERFAAVVRPADTLARIGGDEFGIVLEDAGVDDAEAVARRVLANLGDPFLLRGQDVSISASIGIACTTEARTDVDGVIRNADAAMYAAKNAGGGVAVYRAPMVLATKG